MDPSRQSFRDYSCSAATAFFSLNSLNSKLTRWGGELKGAQFMLMLTRLLRSSEMAHVAGGAFPVELQAECRKGPPGLEVTPLKPCGGPGGQRAPLRVWQVGG